MRPTVYKATYPDFFVKICKDGGSICDFCCKVEIARSTFYEWVGAHEEFRDAFHLGKEYTEAWLTREGIDGMKADKFNSTVWSILMRNKCNYVEHRKVALDFTKCKDANEMSAVLNKRVSEGRLTPAEAKQYSDYIANLVKIDENTELKARVKKLEEDEGL